MSDTPIETDEDVSKFATALLGKLDERMRTIIHLADWLKSDEGTLAPKTVRLSVIHEMQRLAE